MGELKEDIQRFIDASVEKKVDARIHSYLNP